MRQLNRIIVSLMIAVIATVITQSRISAQRPQLQPQNKHIGVILQKNALNVSNVLLEVNLSDRLDINPTFSSDSQTQILKTLLESRNVIIITEILFGIGVSRGMPRGAPVPLVNIAVVHMGAVNIECNGGKSH